ncbi:cytochrome d ubiquinol oxidase subunit II [Streptomyces sp. 6N223]|uniref:cytochrome d ubiquinol oxidase subunit II n=1 Tax=Streptomyces sp. 6N223 TaxID=3457412 RepID=UPI003FD30AAF
METTAACVLGLFAAGYFVLGGAGLGLGMLVRFLGRDAGERREVLAVVARRGPAEGLWLLGVAAALAVCFPSPARGLWPPLAVVAAGFLTRAAGARAGWLRAVACRPRVHGRWWRWGGAPRASVVVVVGSWVEAAGWGWVVASALTGVGPAQGVGAFVIGAAVVLLFLTHGVGVGARCLTGEPFQRARLLAGPRGGRRSVALSSAVMAALPPLAGSRLPLSGEAAPPPVLAAALPPLSLLLAALLWRRRWRPPSRRSHHAQQ